MYLCFEGPSPGQTERRRYFIVERFCYYDNLRFYCNCQTGRNVRLLQIISMDNGMGCYGGLRFGGRGVKPNVMYLLHVLSIDIAI